MRTLLRTMSATSIFLSSVFALAAASEAATLKVSSFPSGAQVLVDGINTGKVTPISVSLTEGDHVITVQIPGSGWNPDTRTVTIVSGNNDLSVTLLPIPAPGPAGPQGIQGPQGVPGPAGPQGIPGDSPAGVMAVTVLRVQPEAEVPFGELPVLHDLNGSPDYGILEASCVTVFTFDDVRIRLRIRNASANDILVVSPNLRLGPSQDRLLLDVETSPLFDRLGREFRIMRFVAGSDVVSIVHVSMVLDTTVAGVCRFTTMTRPD